MTVDISPLKHFALERLPSHSTLRHVLLVEPERLSPEEFLGRIPVWLTLLDLESGKSSSRAPELGEALARRLPRDSKPQATVYNG